MNSPEKSYSVWPWSGASPFSSLALAVRNCFPEEKFDSDELAVKILWDANWEPDGMFVLREKIEGAPGKVHDGAVRGFCVAIHRKVPLQGMPLDSDKGYITLFGVDDRIRGQGYGTQLFDQAENYLKIEGAQTALISPYAPNYFWPGVDIERFTPAVGFLLGRGYREVSRPLAMETDLKNLRWPAWIREKTSNLKADREAGVEIRTYSPDLAPFIHEFMAEDFPGDWQRWVREAAMEIHAGRSKSERLTFAWDRATNTVVGFCHWNKGRFGPVGTAPRVRGRGIGAWLIFDCLERMRAAGHGTAWFMWTDDNTAKLYAEAGFHETNRFVIMAKDL